MTTATTAGPSPAERARTILARTASADVTACSATAEDHADWSLRRLVLCADPPAGGQPRHLVHVEVADAAALPVRERIRGRVRFSGTAAVPSGDCDALHVHAGSVTLVEGEHSFEIPLADLLDADPDPLHELEASMLGHLDTSHGDVLEALTMLVDVRHRLGVVRVWPHRLDRHGLVLRLEHARGHVDQRLPFRVPLTSAQQLNEEMGVLIAHARQHVARCRRTPGSTAVGPVIRAAAAARRICSPQHEDPTG